LLNLVALGCFDSYKIIDTSRELRPAIGLRSSPGTTHIGIRGSAGSGGAVCIRSSGAEFLASTFEHPLHLVRVRPLDQFLARGLRDRRPFLTFSMKFNRIVRIASTSARCAPAPPPASPSRRMIPGAHHEPTPTRSPRRARPATPAPAAPPPRLWSRRASSAARALSTTATDTRTKAASQACGPGCVQGQAAKRKIAASWFEGKPHPHAP